MNTKPRLLLVVFGLFCFFTVLAIPPAAYQKLANGILVNMPTAAPGSAKAVKLEVINSHIIRVTASPTGSFSTSKSLMVIDQKNTAAFTVSETADMVAVKTGEVTAAISLKTGAVSFTDKAGKPITSEVAGSRNLTLAPVDSETQYSIRQSFNSPPDEAIYGLGQHQEGIMNYKGKDVLLMQQNSDVAIPFMVSNKHYGILWDNYSITRFGNTGDYQELGTLALFGKDGKPGGLSATWAHGSDVFLQQQESSIDYPYLNEQSKFPAGYKLTDGTVTWEGSMQAAKTGAYTFHLYHGGYAKLWINGKMILDGWRQSWNPESAKWQIPLEAGKKTTIKLEWKPDGGESYIAFKVLPPVPANQQNQFAFASEAADQVDYYFVYGANMDEIISGYRQLTGKATMLPKWALGFWQSRERYKTQEEILTTVAEFRKRGICLDNIVEDWSYWKQDQWGSHEFDESRFPDPAGMIKTLHEKYHTQFMISVWPKYYTNTANYASMNSKGYLYKRNVELGRRDWIGAGYTSTFYDSYNAGARAEFWKQINEKLYSKGVDGWWMDASEPDMHSNVNIEDRKDFMNPTALGNSTKYFNAYALENARGIYEGQRGLDSKKRVFILTRSAYAGMQRYAASTWSGDVGARWRDLRNQISAGINFSMSGLPYWTMDIGGFAVEKRFEKPNEADKAEWQEQMTRWYQFGAFAPIFRVHGQFPFREIYNTAADDHPAYQSMLFYNRLRYRLMPYIYSLAGNIYQHNYTMMRGLVMDFPADSKVSNIDDQFMFGPSLLVSPVSEYKATNRQLYLPAGTGWYNANDGKFEAGGRTITAAAPYERMPLFVKEGSIVPMGPAIEYTMQKQADTLTLFVYAGKNARFTLYEDEGLTYDYEKGNFSNIVFTWNDAAKTLNIGELKGSFNGMLQQRVIRVIHVDKQHPHPLDANVDADKEIIYAGKAVAIPLH